MANSSLGIYIDDGLIKYAKLQKDKDIVKVEAFNIVFYDNLENELNKIILETGSSKIPISINLSHEMYNYFEVISMIPKKDRAQSIKIDFESLCDEKGYRVEDLEARYLLKESDNNPDKLTAIHVSVDKEELNKTAKMFVGKKLNSIRPISTSIVNLLEVPDDENIVIVNLEKETKVTTIAKRMISRIDTLSVGMKDILDAINQTENSIRKSYEVCKNTTIYTNGVEDINEDGNEHIDEIMPVLYEIVQQTKNIIDDTGLKIDKIYLTGLGSAINNIDLYFQEYSVTAKCEILKPFFLESTSLNTSFKDYIEVNSAIALALDEIGYCLVGEEFNFKKGSSINFDPKSFISNSPEVNIDLTGPLEASEKIMIRIAVICVLAIGIYWGFTNIIMNKIAEMKSEVETNISTVSREITKAEADKELIKAEADHYAQIAEVLRKLVDHNEEIINSVPTISQGAVPNMLKQISNLMPKDVMLLSIKNTTEKHIVIEALSPDYDQLGYFKALLSTNAVLVNVKSSSGQNIAGYSDDERNDEKHNDGQWVYVTIEGDLQ